MYAACLISASLFLVLSLWLFVFRKKSSANFDRSISISGEFWPMTRHPFQYWALASVATISGGSAAILKVLILHSGNLGYGVTFLFSGIAIGLAIFVQSFRKVE
jgi:hypothetical protein